MCGSAGIDLAFIENGFIYHTKYDTADRIHTDSIQRAGETSDVMWLDYKIRRMIIIGCKIQMYSPINFYRLESYLYIWWWTSQMFNNDVLNMFHLFALNVLMSRWQHPGGSQTSGHVRGTGRLFWISSWKHGFLWSAGCAGGGVSRSSRHHHKLHGCLGDRHLSGKEMHAA